MILPQCLEYSYSVTRPQTGPRHRDANGQGMNQKSSPEWMIHNYWERSQ